MATHIFKEALGLGLSFSEKLILERGLRGLEM